MAAPNPIDHPWVVNVTCAALVSLHGLASQLEWLPNVWNGFLAAPDSDQAGVYLGFLGIAGIVSAVAGIVVVFGLTSTSLRFRRFRVAAGEGLARNWTSTTASGLFAAGLAFLASVLAYTPFQWVGPWILELAVLFTAHAAIRLVWLLRGMVDIIRADDVEVVNESKKRRLDSMPWKKAG